MTSQTPLRAGRQGGKNNFLSHKGGGRKKDQVFFSALTRDKNAFFKTEKRVRKRKMRVVSSFCFSPPIQLLGARPDKDWGGDEDGLEADWRQESFSPPPLSTTVERAKCARDSRRCPSTSGRRPAAWRPRWRRARGVCWSQALSPFLRKNPIITRAELLLSAKDFFLGMNSSDLGVREKFPMHFKQTTPFQRLQKRKKK